MNAGYSLMVHGGAGVLAAADDPERARLYLDSLRGVLEAGRVILLRGGSSLDERQPPLPVAGACSGST